MKVLPLALCTLALVATAVAVLVRPKTVASTPAAAGGPQRVNGYLQLGFDRLAGYTFSAATAGRPEDTEKLRAAANAAIPAEIKRWDGEKASVTGFMLPITLEKGLVKEFFLQKDQNTCCFGASAAMNDWVLVRLKQPAAVQMDIPIRVSGTFSVGATFVNGSLDSLYELAGGKIEPLP